MEREYGEKAASIEKILESMDFVIKKRYKKIIFILLGKTKEVISRREKHGN